MDGTAPAVTDPHLPTRRGLDVECPRGAFQNTSPMHALALPVRYDRPHKVAGLESVVPFLSASMPDGNAVPIQPRHLPRSVAGGPDEE